MHKIILLKPLHRLIIICSLMLLVACDSKEEKDTSKPQFSTSKNISVPENTKDVVTVEANDNSSVIYTITGGEDRTKFSITPLGVLSFKNSPDYEAPIDIGKNNTYIVTVTATDTSKNQASLTITVTITDADESKPQFTSTNIISIVEGALEVLTVKATDNATVSYKISGGEDAAKFSVESSSGKLTFLTRPNFDDPKDIGKDNNYLVTITATDPSNNSASQTITVNIIDDTINMTGDYSVASLGKGFKSTATVNLGNTPKTLYALFTNNNESNTTTPVINHKKYKTVSAPKSKIINKKVEQKHQILHAPSRVRLFNKNSKHLLKTNSEISPKLRIITPRRNVVVGESQTFTTDIDLTGAITQTTEATARKVVPSIETAFGAKTLNIWVSDDSYGENCDQFIAGSYYCVTSELVDELADKFLKVGLNNDIYDWVTNIYGEEWGSTPFSDFIEASDEITILLTDINLLSGDLNNPRGGVVGVFHLKDNYKQSEVPGSNERVMFYIDSVVFANDAAAFKYQKLIYATLAHEFTHMLEFYQKDILKSDANTKISSDSWLAEMTAESTEYLTSNLVGHDSPRGINFTDGTDGTSSLTPPNKFKTDRFPDFNKYTNTFSLTSFNNTVQEYSKVSAFGAFLMNNYGGPELLHDIVHSIEVDKKAVVSAVNKFKGTTDTTFGDILRDWGVAVLLSDKDNLELGTPRFNTGDFTTTSYNGIDYNIGSINFFNYITGSDVQNTLDFGPTISTTLGEVQPHGNFFYIVGDGLSGTIEIGLEADSSTEITLIAK